MRSHFQFLLCLLGASVCGGSPVNADGVIGGKETLKPGQEAQVQALNLPGLRVNTTEWCYISIYVWDNTNYVKSNVYQHF